MKKIFYIPYFDFAIAILLFVVSLILGKRGINSIIGAIIFLPSLILWLIAKKQLGKAFRIKPQPDFFVKRGSYSKIRHPIYLFSSLSFLGILISFWNFYLVPFYLALVIVQIIRARIEEKKLIQKFGTEYTRYKKKTIF